MKIISNTEYQELRNKLWDDLISSGVVSDEDENYTAFDNILGNHLNVNWDDNSDKCHPKAESIQKLKQIQENMEVNQNVDWIENDPRDEFKLIAEDINKVIKDLEN